MVHYPTNLEIQITKDASTNVNLATVGLIESTIYQNPKNLTNDELQMVINVYKMFENSIKE